jgi:hypothetical protein
MSEDRTIYEGEFEHGGSGRTVDIAVELERYDVGGGILILAFGGQQVMSSWPDTIEGGQTMIRDLETIKHKLTLAQRAINQHLGDKVVKYLD